MNLQEHHEDNAEGYLSDARNAQGSNCWQFYIVAAIVSALLSIANAISEKE